MKLGFVSAILDGWTFEEMLDVAAEMGYRCVEVACWPRGKAERRYAGVSHIDVENLNDAEAAAILNACKDKGIEISALAFYPNPMDGDLAKRQANISHLRQVIAASAKLENPIPVSAKNVRRLIKKSLLSKTPLLPR